MMPRPVIRAASRRIAISRGLEFVCANPDLVVVGSYPLDSVGMVRAVNEVGFTIEPGELVGFLGPNGAGKTTTLKMLAGLLYPTSGTAKVLGHTPWERHDSYRRQFALVLGQKNQLWWDLPARESLELNAKIYGIPKDRFEKNVGEMTELLGVRDKLNISVRELSLGERMKMELIASLLHKPKVLFLDEPTIGLDVVSQKNVREFLRDYNARHKTTILLTSHYMADIQELCERVIIIDHGRIFFDGRLSEIIDRFADFMLLLGGAFVPVGGILLARFFLGQRLGRQLLVGSAVALTGIGLLVLHEQGPQSAQSAATEAPAQVQRTAQQFFVGLKTRHAPPRLHIAATPVRNHRPGTAL